ncbi:hypothetical protein V1509DRAFT_627895 [Lipomyces kononenkoae]
MSSLLFTLIHFCKSATFLNPCETRSPTRVGTGTMLPCSHRIECIGSIWARLWKYTISILVDEVIRNSLPWAPSSSIRTQTRHPFLKIRQSEKMAP